MKKKSKSHVVQLKEKVKSRILGKRETPLSAYQTEQPQHSDVPAEGVIRNPAYDELGPESDVKLIFHPKVVQFLPVEQHGTTNDAARQVILSRVKPNPKSYANPHRNLTPLAEP